MAKEKRLIDANALAKVAEKRCGVINIKHIDEATTVDAVEVVRCKDCKHKRHNKHQDVILCDHLNGRRHLLKPMDFCSDGERREEDV